MLNLTKGLLLGTILMACSAAPLEEEGETSDAIIDGKSDNGDPAVVAILAWENAQSTNAETCTGTVIAPRVVLTAAHCLHKANTGFTPGVVQVRTAHDFQQADDSQILAAVRYTIHPQFNPTTYVNDLAIVELKNPTSITPIAYNRAAIDSLKGQTARLVGYGRTVANDAASAHEKKSGTVKIADVLPTQFRIEGAPSRQCKGDSGGPILKKVGNKEIVIGVVSSGKGDACVENMLDTRTDTFLSFIDPFVKGTASAPSSSTSSITCCRDGHFYACPNVNACIGNPQQCTPQPSNDARCQGN